MKADPSRLRQIFRKRISNAITFRREEEPPRVHITARKRDGMARFAVTDNGIGIEPRYFDRVIILSQQLQGREKYPAAASAWRS